MKPERKLFRVTPQGSRWFVTCDSDDVVTAVESRTEAVVEATDAAQRSRPSQVVVHGANGGIDDEATYPSGGRR